MWAQQDLNAFNYFQLYQHYSPPASSLRLMIYATTNQLLMTTTAILTFG